MFRSVLGVVFLNCFKGFLQLFLVVSGCSSYNGRSSCSSCIVLAVEVVECVQSV